VSALCSTKIVPESDCTTKVRLENEHLGNMDQYRVTREVPLPYRMDDEKEDDRDDDDQQLRAKRK